MIHRRYDALSSGSSPFFAQKTHDRRCVYRDIIAVMSDFKPRPGTFLPYMEYAKRVGLGERQPASPLTLLEILTRQPDRSLPFFELQTQSRMEPARYGEALKSLLNAGYLTIKGDPLEQVVHATNSGAEVVRLARPA